MEVAPLAWQESLGALSHARLHPADGGQKDPVLAVLLCVRDVRPILLDEFGDDLTHVTLYFD
jgi:hypothetical protein